MEIITLGIGTPADIAHLIWFGLTAGVSVAACDSVISQSSADTGDSTVTQGILGNGDSVVTP